MAIGVGLMQICPFCHENTEDGFGVCWWFGAPLSGQVRVLLLRFACQSAGSLCSWCGLATGCVVLFILGVGCAFALLGPG